MVASAKGVRPRISREVALPEVGSTVSHLERVVTLEVTLYLAALLLGILLRFVLLDQRPLSAGEGALASEAYRIMMGQPPATLHQGAFDAYGTALALLLFGGGDGAARVLPALFGSALVAVPYFLRSTLGRRAALVAAYGMAVSPVLLFASRDVGGGIVASALGLLLWATLAPGLKGIDRGRAYGSALLLAALVSSGVEGITVLATLGVAATLAHPRPPTLLASAGQALASTVGRRAIVLVAAALLVIGTNFGSNPAGVQWVAVDGWVNWLKAFSLSVPRGNLLLLLVLYELPVLLLGVAQLLRTVVRREGVDSLLSLWVMLLLLSGMVQEGNTTTRLVLPLVPLYLLAARFVADTLPLAAGRGRGWRWGVSSLAVAVPTAVAVVLLNRLSTSAADLPAVYLYGEASVVAAAALIVVFLLDGRARAALAWFAVAILSVVYLVHGAAFLNYRMETLSREPLVGTQISPVLRDAATSEAYLARYFRVSMTVDPQLREPLSWYLRGTDSILFSAEPTQGMSLALLQGGAGKLEPGSDRMPGLYAPSISSRDLIWQEVWRWVVNRDGLVRANQRDIIVRAPAGNW